LKIIFDEKPGEIYDIFQSLWVINNYDFYKNRKNNLGVKEENPYEKGLKCIKKKNIINEESLENYFPKEMEPKNVLGLSNLWKYDTIDKFLERIKQMDDHEIWDFIITSIDNITNDGKEEFLVEKANMDIESVINFINSKNIDNSLKWEMLMLLNDREKYIDDFIKFMENYLKQYTTLNEKRQMTMDNLNEEIKENLKKHKVEYLNKLVSGIFSFEEYKRVYVTTSALSSLIIADEYSSDCFVVLGPYLKGIKDKFDEKNDIEEKLDFIKNICESTKFKIIKLLLKRDYYGLEIAKELGLTKATVSYHMDFLVTAKVAYIKKEGQKVYYSLNKEALKRGVEFLKDEFNV